MASSKRSKAAPTDDELGELFEGIGDEKTTKKTAKPKASAATKGKSDSAGQDILAELEEQLVDEKASRPHTPRIRDTAAKGSPARLSEDRQSNIARKSGESTRSQLANVNAASSGADQPDYEKRPAAPEAAPAAGAGWWGGIFATATATASAAMKQAEAAVNEIRQNEEAKKWADQVRGNVGVISAFGRSSSLLSLAVEDMLISGNRCRTPTSCLADLHQHSPYHRSAHLVA
jgi:hypothetical protein